MKKLYKIIIQIYHFVFFSNLKSCRFEPTCSQYLLDSVEKYGSVKGLQRAILRIFSCHPFTKRPIIDPA